MPSSTAWAADRRGGGRGGRQREGEVQVQAAEDGDEEEPGEAPATFSFRNTNRLTIFYSTTAFRSLVRSLNRYIISVVPHVNGNTVAISYIRKM